MEILAAKQTRPVFLSGIIPDNWEEFIFEYDDHYLIRVEGNASTEAEWENYFKMLNHEFGEMLEDFYRLPEDDTVFEVYLKKTNT